MLTHSKAKIYWALIAFESIELRRDMSVLRHPFSVLSHLVFSSLLSQDVRSVQRVVSCGCFLSVWEMIRCLIVLSNPEIDSLGVSS